MGDAPVSDDFWLDADEEAAYQLAHWGETHDADKDDSFWFWTLGHIVGKAIHDPQQTTEKLRHRLRAGAALLRNWDRHVAARNGLPTEPLMRMDRPAARCVEAGMQGIAATAHEASASCAGSESKERRDG